MSRLIAVEPLRVAVPRDDPCAAQPGLALASLSGEPFVAQRRDSAMRQLTDELCRQAGFSPNVVFEGDDLSTVRGFVAAGLGVAIVPAPRQGSPEAAAGPLRFCEITDVWAAREITVSWSADRRLLPAAAAVPPARPGPGLGRRGPGPDVLACGLLVQPSPRASTLSTAAGIQ